MHVLKFKYENYLFKIIIKIDLNERIINKKLLEKK